MRVKLGDVCVSITDGSHNPPVGIEQSPYIMLSSKNIEDNHISLTSPRYLSETDYASENKRTQISAGDILVTIVGTIGRVAIVPTDLEGICVQRSVAVLKANPDIVYNRFLMYQLQNMRPYLEREAKGVAQKGVYLKQLSSLAVSIPPMEEQKRIAAVLDKVTDLIAKRQAQLDKLDELVKSRFVEMFGDPKMNPNNYPIYPLSEHIYFLTSGSRGWARYCTDDGSEWFITIKNVKDCHISADNMQSIDAPDNAEAKRTKVREGDLLISITADLGRTGVVTKEIAEHGAYINQHLTCIRLNQSTLNPLYAAYYMESPAGKEQFAMKNQNAVKAGLNFNAINSLRIMVPPIDKQNAFVEFVAQIDKLKLKIRRNFDRLGTLRETLMQQYFGGTNGLYVK